MGTVSNLRRQAGRIVLRRGDCFEELESLRDGSIDAIISDPPFGVTDCAWDKAIDWPRWWELAWRKLKPTGVCALFACGKFTFTLQAACPEFYRYDLIWEKTRPVGFLWSAFMPLRSHESIMIFSRVLKGTTYNAQKTPATQAARRSIKKCIPTQIYHGKGQWIITETEDGSRHPRSVLRFAKGRKIGGHPTEKPLALMEWLVKTYTNPGDLVCDPFAGSGTTAIAAVMHDRRFFGCEKNAAYFRAAQKRIDLASADRAAA